MEIFKDIKGYEGYYQISNLGNVKSIKCSKNKILKPAKGNGYLSVVLCKNGIATTNTIHRLITIHFIPNPDNKLCTNHKNGIKTDNRIDNLEWVTYSENTMHSLKNGLQKIQKGSERGRVAKLNEKQVKEIKLCIDKKEMLKDISRKFNVCPATISAINVSRTWCHV